jgi:uncharacterized protein (DUF1778 family)
MSRLTIEIDADEHRLIKTLATFSGMTMKEYILSKVLPTTRDARLAEGLSQDIDHNAQRLREAIAQPQESHQVFKDVEDLRHALGI